VRLWIRTAKRVDRNEEGAADRPAPCTPRPTTTTTTTTPVNNGNGNYILLLDYRATASTGTAALCMRMRGLLLPAYYPSGSLHLMRPPTLSPANARERVDLSSDASIRRVSSTNNNHGLLRLQAKNGIKRTEQREVGQRGRFVLRHASTLPTTCNLRSHKSARTALTGRTHHGLLAGADSLQSASPGLSLH
jgi:hypothetical protein